MATRVDTIIVGAGAAGLAAARELQQAGSEFLVLEARERIGGRIYTVRDARCALPIELGAEFLHGESADTMEIVRAAGLHAVDISGEHWRGRNGKLRPIGDFWHDLDLVMRRIDQKQPDESFRDFLERKPGGRSLARQRKLALEFVQGFHAADVDRISIHALAEGGSPGEDPEESRQSRLIDGYDAVPRFLAHGCGDRILTGVQVTLIRWKKGSVEVHGADGRSYTARTVIITVPLGVLQSNALTIDPPIATLERAKAGLAMGASLRVALLFKEPFWEERSGIANGKPLLDLSFVHATEQPIPVWWTAYPSRVPLMVGWAGGGKAKALGELTQDALATLGVETVARIFDLQPRTLRTQVVASWTHDWQRDPNSLGAYSYAVVGGAEASKLLARSAQRTVYFAGEAADAEGRNGTVDGALGSGRAAGKRVIAALG
jgi:monoamine oxidase